MYSDWKLKKDWHPMEIFHVINNAEKKCSNDKYFKDYIIVITGKGGRTGKTSLCQRLNDAGFKAVELAEEFDMIGLVEFKDDDNHVIVDSFRKTVLIVLNKYLIRYFN